MLWKKLTPISMVIKKFMRMRSLNVESLYWGNPHEDSYFIVRYLARPQDILVIGWKRVCVATLKY